MMGGYKREVQFYQQIADRAPIDTPDVDTRCARREAV